MYDLSIIDNIPNNVITIGDNNIEVLDVGRIGISVDSSRWTRDDYDTAKSRFTYGYTNCVFVYIINLKENEEK